MTVRTHTFPLVTAALLAHGVTDWSTHDFRGSVQVGDRGIIVAGAGPVRSEDVPEGWFYDDETGHVGGGGFGSHVGGWRRYPVVTRAARAVGTVAEVVPIVDYASPGPRSNPPTPSINTHHGLVHWWHHDGGWRDIGHLLPFADWSPTTKNGRQRWAVRWEDMRVIEPAVTKLPCRCTNRPCPFAEWVPLHSGWRPADPGLIEAVGEASDGA